MKTAILALLLLCSAGASAEPYVFGSGEGMQIKAKVGEGLSKSTTGFSLGAGYRFSRYFAAEASYLKSGRIHGEDADRDQGINTFSTSHFYDVKGFGIAALGMLPVGERFSLVGKLGANRLTLTHTSQTTQTAAGSFVGVQASTTQEQLWLPSIGIGAEFSPVRELQFRAMLEQVSGRSTLDRMRMLSLSAVFSF